MFWRKANEWTEYTSELEHFRACFPGEVRRHFRSFVGVDDGKSPASISYTCDQSTFLKKLIYQVAVTRVMEYFGSPEEFLNTAVGEMMQTLQGAELQSSEFTTFAEDPAVEFRVVIKGLYRLRGMTVLVANTLYVLTVFSSPNIETHYEKFASSLHII